MSSFNSICRPPGECEIIEPCKTIFSYISEEELSPDEVRLLEAENAELLAEFQTAKDSVKLIETKVVRIAELQV